MMLLICVGLSNNLDFLFEELSPHHPKIKGYSIKNWVEQLRPKTEAMQQQSRTTDLSNKTTKQTNTLMYVVHS